MPSAATRTRRVADTGADHGVFSSPEKRTLVLCLVLVAATLVAYNPVNHNAFVNYDDAGYIVENPHVHAGLSWETVRWSFTTFEQANWHPLTWITHALDYQLFKLNPAGPHYVNVLFHAVNAVLLFLLFQRATNCTWRSLAVASLFALHPVNVESVAWAAERKTVLSMTFLLLAMMAYGVYAQKPAVRRYLVVAAFFALGLMAKPQIITLPFVLLLWDYWPLGRMVGAPGSRQEGITVMASHPLSWLVLEKIPLILLAAASVVVTIVAQSSGGAVRSAVEFSLGVRIENALVAYVRYIGKAFWPTHLAAIYPHPGGSLPGWEPTAAATCLAVVTVLVFARRREGYLPVGWFWFLGTLVPMIGLVQVGDAAMADRYAYLPFVGLFTMVCWWVGDWSERLQASPVWLAAAAAVVLAALGATTYRQVGYWRNSDTLWSHTLAVTENNYVAHDNMGGALLNEGRIEEAVAHFRAAVAIHPNEPMAHLNLGTYEYGRGNLPAAIEQYRMVLDFTSDTELRAQAYANLGSVFRDRGEYSEARQSYEDALRLNPRNPIAILGMGVVAEHSGNWAEAIRQFSQAVQLQPTATGYVLLAGALQQSGRATEAQAAMDQAQQLTPDLSQAKQEATHLLAR